MARSLSNEDEIYEKIEKEKITIHPVVWELMTHHIGNDLSIITMALDGTVLSNRPKPLDKETAQKMHDHAFNIKALISKLREATGRGGKF